MSIQAVAWVIQQSPRDLPKDPRLVMIILANHTNHKTGACFPQVETICEETGISRASVFRILAALVRNKYLRKEQTRAADGRQRANNYFILFDREPFEWSWLGQNDNEDDAESHGSGDDDLQDIEAKNAEDPSRVSPGDSVPGLNTETPPGDQGLTLRPRPSLIAETHKDSDKPEESNLKKDSTGTAAPAARAPALGAAPRSYQPPPPPPPPVQGSQNPLGFFVLETSRAYRAWQAHKTRESGRPWNLSTSHVLDHDAEFDTKNGKLVLRKGQSVRGWFFPSLFPPGHAPPADNGTLATDAELEEFGKTG